MSSLKNNQSWIVALLGLSLSLYSLEAKTTRAEQFPPDNSMIYKTIGETELRLHIFLPKDHAPSDLRPTAVFFHGGGWKGGTPSQFFPQARHLADQGMVAISSQYRLRSTDGVDPDECVRDAKSTVRWVRQHAAELGIDPQRLMVGGASAGGQLALAAALITGFEPEGEDASISVVPNALVLFNPVIDMGPGGVGHDRVKPYWESISPLQNVTAGAPPTLILSGTEDNLIPVSDIEQFETRMQAVGARCDVVLYEGAGHGFFNEGKKHYAPTIGAMDDFLRSLGYLP
jgi:acetyl esterase/lipase